MIYDELIKSGSNVYFLPKISHLHEHIKCCKSIIQKGNYDIIHNNCLIASLPLMLVASKSIKKRILHAHSSKCGETFLKSLRNKLFLPLLLRTANCYCACSSVAGNAVFGHRRFYVIPNLIDPSRFRFNPQIRSAIRRKEKVENKFIIGTVARFANAKNPYFAIDLIEQLYKLNPNIEYWWIGNDEISEHTHYYISKRGLDHVIRFWGHQDKTEYFYQAIDLFILPSKFEGLGIVLIEAQSSGLTCLVSDRIPREVNVTGDVYFLKTTKNKQKWIETFLSLSHKRDRTNAYKAVEESVFSISSNNKVLEKLFFELYDS